MLILLSINILCVVLTIVSVAWETRFDWPDNVHVDYGFPFVWSTNTLSTISGAANIWIVNIAVVGFFSQELINHNLVEFSRHWIKRFQESTTKKVIEV